MSGLLNPQAWRRRNETGWGICWGGGIANVAEVKTLDKTEFNALRNCGVKLRERANWRNTYLVRFAPLCLLAEQPRQDLDSALAAELVFSMWIRRRDAHSFNRSFVHGVPIFYDHGTAFLGERKLQNIDQFFSIGPDPGYAGLWRLNDEVPRELTTLKLRQQEHARFTTDGGQLVNFLPVHDKARFLAEMDRTRDQIKSILPEHLTGVVRQAGFGIFTAGPVIRLLHTGQQNIDEELVKLKSVIARS